MDTPLKRNVLSAHPYMGFSVSADSTGQPQGSVRGGWKTVEITPHLVGKKLAVFVAVEVKTHKGGLTEEQDNFLRAVKSVGGVAIKARNVNWNTKLGASTSRGTMHSSVQVLDGAKT